MTMYAISGLKPAVQQVIATEKIDTNEDGYIDGENDELQQLLHKTNAKSIYDLKDYEKFKHDGLIDFALINGGAFGGIVGGMFLANRDFNVFAHRNKIKEFHNKRLSLNPNNTKITMHDSTRQYVTKALRKHNLMRGLGAGLIITGIASITKAVYTGCKNSDIEHKA